MAGEEAGESMRLLLESDGAGLHPTLQMLLVPLRSIGDLGVGDGNEDAAADVAREVD